MSKREAQIEAKIKALYAELKAIRSNRFWRCPLCKKSTKISALEVQQTYWYDIEDWRASDSFKIHCPKCKTASSGVAGSKFHPAFAKIKDNLSYFKKIVPEYDR